MKQNSTVKMLQLLTMLIFTTIVHAQSKQDSTTIRNIIQEETTTWNNGDGEGYSKHFAEYGTFTNILGMFFTGHEAFTQRHVEIFKGTFRGTKLQQDIVSFRFVNSGVAVVETLTWISGFSTDGPPQGTHLDANGRLVTRLLQVIVKESNDWKIEVYHNVDVKPGVIVPESK
jgi:uncharacterized protein (TIGR02246 family)